MVLWVVPGCPFSRRLSRHWDLVTLLLILLLASGTLIKSSRSQNSHHYPTHTVSTKYGSLRGVKLQFSSSATKHLGKFVYFSYISYFLVQCATNSILFSHETIFHSSYFVSFLLLIATTARRYPT